MKVICLNCNIYLLNNLQQCFFQFTNNINKYVKPHKVVVLLHLYGRIKKEIQQSSFCNKFEFLSMGIPNKQFRKFLKLKFIMKFVKRILYFYK